MKVILNTPKPVPPTYDLLGLTEAEVRTIRVALGEVNYADAVRGGEVNNSAAGKLWDELREKTGVTYSYNGKPGF
jgi:hypothetical protein